MRNSEKSGKKRRKNERKMYGHLTQTGVVEIVALNDRSAWPDQGDCSILQLQALLLAC